MENVELKRKVTLKRKGGDAPPPKPKWWLWLLLLAVAVVAVIVVLCLKNGSQGSNNGSFEIEDTAIEQSANAATEEEAGAEQPVETEKTSVPGKPTTPATDEETIVSQPETPVSTPPAASPVTDKTSVPGSIEEKAKRAIRGDFGNGAERINNLGSEYNAIQSKVNEMYRNGNINY
jgi:hypothetical protein